MRPIDADALMEIYMDRLSLVADRYSPDSSECGILTGAVKLLDAQPTIEPEPKTGEWIVTSEFDDCCYAKCNQCNVTQIFYYGKPLTNFCPNCGADMREGQDDSI